MVSEVRDDERVVLRAIELQDALGMGHCLSKFGPPRRTNPTDAWCPPISSTASPATLAICQQLLREPLRLGVVRGDDVEGPQAEHDRRDHARRPQLIAQFVRAGEPRADTGISVTLQVHQRDCRAHLKAEFEFQRPSIHPAASARRPALRRGERPLPRSGSQAVVRRPARRPPAR